MNDRTLPIGEITSPYFKGLIGVHPYPGKIQGLDGDLDRIKRWGVKYLISFIEDREFIDLKITDLGAKAKQKGMYWTHLPIDDMACPDDRFEPTWLDLSIKLKQCLTDGGRIAFHCQGGYGRSGMMAAKLLIEFGHSPKDAISMVRNARGSAAIESAVQENYLYQVIQ